MFVGPVSRITKTIEAFEASFVRVLPHPRKPGPTNSNQELSLLNDEFTSSHKEKEISI